MNISVLRARDFTTKEATTMHSADALNLHRLWRAVLNQLLSDAAGYAKDGRLPVGETLQAMQEAYQDVTECGPMLRYVCSMQHDDIGAEAVAEGFRRWCQAKGYEPAEAPALDGRPETARRAYAGQVQANGRR